MRITTNGSPPSTVACLAVPDQGASDIPLDDLRDEGRTLSMSFPVPGGGRK